MYEGRIDADLGGGVIKQRIAGAGTGKSGGSRSILLFRKGDRAVFVYGFEKKDRASIKPDELEAFHLLADIVLGYTPEQIAERIKDGDLIPVNNTGGNDDGEEIPQQRNGCNP